MSGQTHQSPTTATVITGKPESSSSVRIATPTALISAVPYLLGFQPGRDMVIIGTRPPGHTAKVTLRYSLDPAAVTDQVRHALALLAMNRCDTAAAVGYGSDELVTPFMDWLRPEAGQHGIRFTELLRVDAGQQRYWSYLCENPDCCRPEGTPYDLGDGATATEIFAGGVSGVLASREALARMIAPSGGEEAVSMIGATRKAERRAARLLRQAPRPGKPVGRHGLALAGITAVQQAIEQYRRGDALTHDEAAWLLVVLKDLWVRDDAWSRMEPGHRTAHVRLWTDLTRLALLPRHVPAPATLLAFVAWQGGNGAFANVALDRAQAADPDYSMARILRDALAVGLRAEQAELPMTPGEVADSYAEHYGVDG